jgi:CDP-glycerol glycerophosphotransferase (TagB/SpsB family)
MMLQIVRKLVAGRRPAPMDRVESEILEIERLGIFDRQAYLQAYPDVAAAGIEPIRHYVTQGIREGRNPCMFFDTTYYYGSNPDVAKAGLNPLLHYFEFGWDEGRNPSADFDGAWYARTHLASANGRINPLLHYLGSGRNQGLETRPVIDLDAQTIHDSGIFDADYYLEQYPDIAESGADPLRHYLSYGAREGRNPNACFDTKYYLKHNRDVAARRINPLLHFCRDGWKELRNPHPEFDVWWYWSTHLDPASDEVNPLAHYCAVGREQGLQARPPRHVAQLAGSGYRHQVDRPVRRICLFAGYDVDGLVDDYVVDYLRELSRYADIHYLADCEMQPGELDKITAYTKSADAERHGEYDFGSYSRLARQVGWETIGQYDELILANDSCYLLRDLQQVFAKMDDKACDWWGMQATKGLASTRGNPRNRFLQPIPMTAVRASLLGTFENDYRYDFHVGSYFVVYRKPVIGDKQFRRLLDSVGDEDSKRNIILKYEVGLTRYLIASGFAFDTLIEHLYPFHPIYSNWYFQLLDEGFPFLKRYLLSNNHYRIPGLSAWKEKVLRKLPQADVATIELNLQRVVDSERLHENLHIGTPQVIDEDSVPAELLDDETFIAADQASPKYAHWWAFPVCAFTGVFSGNERAVFEEVKDDPSIRKIVLTRGQPVVAEGANVDVVPLHSPQGQYLLMRAGNVFIKHSPTRNLVFPVAAHLHNLINLWHGIPLKRIGYASLDMQHQQQAIAHEHLKCRAVISSSQIDTLAMAAAFYPLAYGDIWPTGLPRNDFILRGFDALPADMQASCQQLEALLDGRKLVLFMPTFRNGQEDAYYRFSDAEIDWLGGWLQRNDAVLGIREHMADNARVYTRMLQRLAPLDLSDTQFPDAELLYRHAALLVTDYSSCFIDFMLTGRPAVSFAYDHESYASIERGFFYDLDMVFPGPVCRTFAELQAGLEGAFTAPAAAAQAALDLKRRIFFDQVDDHNAARLVARVKRLGDFDDIGRHSLAIGV